MEVKVTENCYVVGLGSSQKPKVLTESVKLNCNSWKGGGEANTKKNLVEKV